MNSNTITCHVHTIMTTSYSHWHFTYTSMFYSTLSNHNTWYFPLPSLSSLGSESVRPLLPSWLLLLYHVWDVFGWSTLHQRQCQEGLLRPRLSQVWWKRNVVETIFMSHLHDEPNGCPTHTATQFDSSLVDDYRRSGNFRRWKFFASCLDGKN